MELIWRCIERFRDRTQDPDETVDDYVKDKQYIAQKAEQPEDFVIASVIYGFHPHIREHIMIQPQAPRTLDETIRKSWIPSGVAGLRKEAERLRGNIISSQSGWKINDGVLGLFCTHCLG